ncbi:mucin-3A [Apis mellifera]|uniref:Mucin-3A n=1 Tax=Apis mellifera TaxID=7460 RepID=A0A7M7MNP1_APIME|nr:mucin-3A [Apis mellifera]|eukprot:XP_026298740.1 mucin-3A [Apis mellifera]
MNQYFDKEKGFCLNVLGGGKALYINNTSCGTNVLKPHCYNPRYYYICKRNKTILAQCSQNKHFEVHLQKCTLIYHGKNIPNKTNSNSCERVGVFPIPNDCHQFYTCTAYGHRMKQNFYICPRNMAFDTKTEMCKPSKTCKESRLSSTCLFSSEKEEMTLEEANMFLRPMDQKEKSLTCETIFTNDEETITTERNYNNDEIKSTTTSYNKPSISKFTEPSDRNFTTTIERASETSHSTNTIASEIYTTAIYSPANEEITYTTEQNLSTEIKKNGEENLESSTSKESYKQEHNGKTDNDNVQSTDAMKTFSTEPTILNDTISTGTGSETQPDIEIKTPPNELPNFENQHKEPEINLNDPSSEFINITPNIEIPNTTPVTDDLNEPLTIDEEITDLPSITIKSNLDEEEYTKINSNDPPSEIPNITQPNIKIPNSTPVTEDLNEPTTEKEIIDLSSATINDNTDVEKPEINLNDPEFLNATQPNIEIPNSTPVTEDLNELLATEKEIIDLPPAINDNPDVEKPEINLNDPEFLNATQPNIEIPNSTPVTEDLNELLATEKEIIDLPPTINDNPDVEKPEINLNDPEFLNTTQPNIEISNSTPVTEDLNELLATEKEIIDLPPATINDNPDVEKPEINLNDPEFLNTTQPNIEIPNNTPATEYMNEPLATEKEIIDLLPSTTDTITNSNPDVEEHTESEITSNDPSSEIPNITQPNIEIPYSTAIPEDLNEPTTEKEIIDLLPSTTDTILIAITYSNPDIQRTESEITSNNPSSEISNITQPNLDIPYSTPATEDLNESTTEKEIIDLLPSTTDKITNSNPDVEEHTESEITSNNPSSEIPNITQPNIEIPYSTAVPEDLNEPTTEKEIIDLLPSTTDTITYSNPDIQRTESEITSNNPSSEIPNITQPNLDIPYSTPATEDLNESTTEKEIIDLLPSTTDKITNSNPDVEEHTESEITSNDPSSEIPNITQPNIDIPYSTPATEDLNEPATEKEIIDLLSSTTDTIINNSPDIQQTEITSNDPSSEIPNITEPNIEIPYSTSATEDLNEPTTEKEIIDLLPSTTDTITNSNPDIQRTESEITSNNPSSEIPNITQPNLDIPYSTPATEDLNESTTEKEIIDLLPSTTDKITNSNPDVEEHTESEVTSNDPSSEIPNITQPNIEIPYSIPATEDLNEPATEKEIIDLSSATINDNPDVEKPEINLNDPEFLNTTQPNIEIPNSTPVTEDLNESVTEKEIIDLLSSTTDTIINSNPDVEEHTELEITSNDPSSEIPNITQPNIDIPYSTPATEDLNEPTTEKEIIDLLPSTTDTITNSNPDIQQTESEITSNDPSSEIPNITQPNIEIPYSTPATEDLNEPATEKEIIDSLSSTTDRITNSNPDIQQTESEITSNDPLSGILNTGEHNIEIPNSTPVTIKSNKSIEKENSDFISIMTNNDSEVENKKKIDINLNDPLSEILVTGIPNTEIEHSIVTTIKVTEYSTFESESSDTVSEIPFNTLTSIKENDTVINVSDPSMEITTPSLENIVTNGEETFMKISNNDRTENNIFAESVTDAMESSSISENINNNFQSYVSPISVNPASYSSMISENKVEEPTSIPITDRIALNKNEENNTPSIEFNMKTNSPTEINTKYTTISINKKLDNIGNEKLTLSSDTDISETDKSISQTNKLTTSFRDLIAKCKNHMSAETTTQSTKLNPSNEKYSDPFHMQSHSLVSDKKNANKQNKIFEEEEDSLWKRIYSGKTISKNFILPITSAVLNFVDKFECYLKNTLIKIFH